MVVYPLTIASLIGRWLRRSPLIETGLKAIDLLVPISVGSDVLISGDPESGIRVLGMELAQRLMSHPRQKFHVVLYLDEALDDLDSWVLELQESLPSFDNRIVVRSVSSSDIQNQLLACGNSAGFAVFAISRSDRFLYGIQSAIRSVRQSDSSALPITSFALTEKLAPPGYDITIVCSRTLASAGVYPALNPHTSTSTVSSQSVISKKHRRVAESTRAAINQALGDLYPDAMTNPDWPFNQDKDKRPAAQAMCFMSQPYYVAEPFTGLMAANIPLHQTVNDFEVILSGKYQDHAPKEFLYQNGLTDRLGT